jgi:hypothetical protein
MFETVPEHLRIFTYEEKETEQRKRQIRFKFWKPHFSYSRCFNWVFFTFGMIGVVIASVSLLQIIKLL